MILSQYYDTLDMFKIIDELKASSNVTLKEQELLNKLAQRLLLFKCPSCGTPIGYEISEKDWDQAWLDHWSEHLRSAVGLNGGVENESETGSV